MHATFSVRRTGLAALTLYALLAPGTLRAALHGGIEIGGKGVKATALEATGEGEDVVFKTKYNHTTNTALSGGVAKNGHFDPEALEQTAQAVKKYYDRFRKFYEVPADHIYIVGSSGLFAPIQGKQDLIEKNQQALAAAVKKATGLTPTFISARREAELSILGTLPKGRQKNGVLIDIGGGNTKGGYLAGPGKFATFKVPFGSVTFNEYAKKQGARNPKALAELAHKTLPPLLKKELGALPELAKRDRIYLSGGVVWAVTTFAHPGGGRPYTPLTLKDVQQVAAKLAAAPGSYPEADLAGIADPKSRRRAEAEIARVKKVYPAENLLAGVQILESAMQEVGAEKQFFFVRQGYLGWILAYVTAAAEGGKAP